MNEEKIKKINILYLLGYIFIPILVCAICFLIGMMFFPKGLGAVIFFLGPSALSVLWWTFGGTLLFKSKTKKFEQKLDSLDFSRDSTFYGKGKVVILDMKKGQIGLVFFWNPTMTYIVPATRVKQVWVDDGKFGSGFMEGSSRVSFLFTIDDVTIRVDTFTSNQRFRMDSDYILTGISKADMMVKAINDAKQKSKSSE